LRAVKYLCLAARILYRLSWQVAKSQKEYRLRSILLPATYTAGLYDTIHNNSTTSLWRQEKTVKGGAKPRRVYRRRETAASAQFVFLQSRNVIISAPTSLVLSSGVFFYDDLLFFSHSSQPVYFLKPPGALQELSLRISRPPFPARVLRLG